MHKLFSKTSLRVLSRAGMIFVNAIMLTSVLLSNVTGVVQASTAEGNALKTFPQKNPSVTDNTYTPPSFTQPAPRMGKMQNSSATIPSGASKLATTCVSWNLANDFRLAPNQENPNRDLCGNPGIWKFMESASLTLDPATYSLMPTFNTVSNFWAGTYVDGNGTFPVVQSALTSGTAVIYVHPAPGRMAIIGWRSTLNGFVSVSGGAIDNDPN
ncbi:MAG TPA: hypothetical protein VFI68_11120, partial [Anaerolineales bacterium]|nr:hypothetical protein [Anaerolineales bacterium]